MAVQPTIAVPQGSRHTWLIVAAVLVAVIVVVAVAVAVTRSTNSSTAGQPAQTHASASPASQTSAIMSLTPAIIAGLDSGYERPGDRTSPSVATVLASMSPSTRRYTEALMALTFRQLAAGAAGSP